jgi:hypothetical protein
VAVEDAAGAVVEVVKVRGMGLLGKVLVSAEVGIRKVEVVASACVDILGT